MAGQITSEFAKAIAPGVASACAFASEYFAKKKLSEAGVAQPAALTLPVVRKNKKDTDVLEGPRQGAEMR